jgi:DMSO/TMAO reductase YedYZ molybdopterin-dependent catalytic subunit
MTSEQRLERLPVFLLPGEQAQAGPATIAVGGLVATPLTLGLDRIKELPAVEFTADFGCEEGWRVPGLRWRGVRLFDLLRLAGPLPAAHTVAVGSGGFVATLPLAQIDAESPLLAYELDSAPLPAEHGGPLRLIAPWTACYQTVKWIDRIELVANTSSETASIMARSRVSAQPAPRTVE